ncbi:hypothetical protein MNBD_ACTINO01-1789 [hydrothermal vent metagenome]|uniref:Uncharacterized protein n=1 Tax=hydrothermal vent metagenome TaxID=652676 RepID=A0A3B0SSY4_9ZZZZ
MRRIPRALVAGSIPAEGARSSRSKPAQVHADRAHPGTNPNRSPGLNTASVTNLAPMKIEITRKDDEHLVVNTRDQTLFVHRGVSAEEATDGFRAGELVLSGLGACMLGTALTFARNTNIDIEDMHVSIEGVSAPHPERIETIRVTMTVTGDVTDKQLTSLARVAARCKIHNTLADTPTIELDMVTAG